MNVCNLYGYKNSEEKFILEKGIIGNNNIFIYLRDKYFYVQDGNIRCFKFSMRRVKNTLNISDTNHLLSIIIRNIKSIHLEKNNENLFYLNLFSQKIKLKEINNFLIISNTDTQDVIIEKQKEKIITLLNKINEFENKYKEPTTDEELILIIK